MYAIVMSSGVIAICAGLGGLWCLYGSIGSGVGGSLVDLLRASIGSSGVHGGGDLILGDGREDGGLVPRDGNSGVCLGVCLFGLNDGCRGGG